MLYRRTDVEGGTSFFTVNLAERKRTILVDHMDVLRTVMKKMKVVHAFRIDAMVILPDQGQAQWPLPAGEADFAARWASITADFSRRLPTDARQNQRHNAKGARGIWQWPCGNTPAGM